MPTIANPQLRPRLSRARHVPTHGSLIKAVGTRTHEATNRGAFYPCASRWRRSAGQARAGAPGSPADQPPRACHHGALASRTLRDAHASRPTLGGPALIRRGAVRHADDVITAVISRLDGPHPVSPRGMAQLERLLTNADNSPLYKAAAPGALRQAMSAVLCALEPDRGAGPDHEFPLS